jgi:triacylglycerol lipase
MRWLCALLVLVIPLAAEGTDRHDVSRPTHRRISSLQHDGSSPFPPPASDDTVFIVDTGGDLDTSCTYRSGGPLVIHLPITRYIGPVTGNHTLTDASRLKLVAEGFLSENAHLRLPAYDVDINGDPSEPTTPPEIDRITFNGHDLGTLTGDNEIWKLNEFNVPIEWVKFPSIGSDGSLPTPADNVIVIDIDTASGGEDNWCTAVDWAELDFAAIAPIFLVHGILVPRDIAAWPNFHAVFTDAEIPFSDEIDLSQVGSIDGNAAILAGRLRSVAAKFGAKKCHIIAHSKGGLDSRAYLNGAYDADELRVLSLYTLSTPHHGTALADLGLALEAGLAIGSPTLRLIPQLLPFISDLSTVSTGIFNFRYGTVPFGVNVYCYGADADVNHDGVIDAGEAAQLELFGFAMPPVLATAFYNFVGSDTTVKVTFGTQTVHLWGNVSFAAIDVEVTQNITKNDVLVTTVSAEAPFGAYVGTLPANHASMKSRDLAEAILKQIRVDHPNR